MSNIMVEHIADEILSSMEKVASNEELTVEKIAQEVVIESMADKILNSIR